MKNIMNQDGGDLGNDNEKFFDPTLPVEENQDLQLFMFLNSSTNPF